MSYIKYLFALLFTLPVRIARTSADIIDSSDRGGGYAAILFIWIASSASGVIIRFSGHTQNVSVFQFGLFDVVVDNTNSSSILPGVFTIIFGSFLFALAVPYAWRICTIVLHYLQRVHKDADKYVQHFQSEEVDEGYGVMILDCIPESDDEDNLVALRGGK